MVSQFTAECFRAVPAGPPAVAPPLDLDRVKAPALTARGTMIGSPLVTR